MEPLPVQRYDALEGEYALTCQHPGCPGIRIIQHALSGGLREGDLVPHSPANPDFGKCLRCKRYTMKVTATPPPPAPPKPKGFTRVPTK